MKTLLCLIMLFFLGYYGHTSPSDLLTSPAEDLPTHHLNFIAGTGGSLEGSTNQNITQGQVSTAIKAVPTATHIFLYWKGEGLSRYFSQTLIIRKVTGSMTLTAIFKVKTATNTLPTEWRQAVVDADPTITSISQVTDGGDLDDDGFTNLEEMQQGLSPLEFNYKMYTGWNLIHLPRDLSTEALSLDVLFPHKTGSVWRWESAHGEYQSVQTLTPGTGCWVYWDAPPEVISIPGEKKQTNTTPLHLGWNLIGLISSVTLPESSFINSQIWYWDATLQQYQQVQSRELKPGRGYWIYAQQTASIKITDHQVTFQKVLLGVYIAFDLTNGTQETFSEVPAGGWGNEFKTSKLLMRRIPKGTFTMGAPYKELGWLYNETAQQVTLSQDYYIGVFELTQAQHQLITGDSSQAYFDSGEPTESLGEVLDKMRPMETISYDDIRGISNGANWPTNSQVERTSLLGKLRAKFGDTAFDLPTEAQWEYACRAGTSTALNSGKNLTAEAVDPEMDKLGWYGGNVTNNGEAEGTKVVGRKSPNNWGLYDMHGNVWEWCLDWYSNSYPPSATTDPKGATSGYNRDLRGGSWRSRAKNCRSAKRNYFNPSYRYNYDGLRLVVPAVQ